MNGCNACFLTSPVILLILTHMFTVTFLQVSFSTGSSSCVAFSLYYIFKCDPEACISSVAIGPEELSSSLISFALIEFIYVLLLHAVAFLSSLFNSLCSISVPFSWNNINSHRKESLTLDLHIPDVWLMAPLTCWVVFHIFFCCLSSLWAFVFIFSLFQLLQPFKADIWCPFWWKLLPFKREFFFSPHAFISVIVAIYFTLQFKVSWEYIYWKLAVYIIYKNNQKSSKMIIWAFSHLQVGP